MNTESLLKSLQWRYATKVFDKTKKIDDATVKALEESLRLSASSFGLQPWKFVVVQNPDLRKQLSEHCYGQTQVADCSHLFVLCRKTEMTDREIEHYFAAIAKARGIPLESLQGFHDVVMNYISAHRQKNDLDLWMTKQVYIALGTLLTACAVLKVDACPMEGIDLGAFDTILGLKQLSLTAIVACPIGYRDANDKYAQLPKVRFCSDEVIIKM